MSTTPKKVKIYSTDTCGYCKMAKNFFDTNKVAYEALDVGHDKVAREEMVTKSGQMGVPVIDIDGEIIIGFDQPKIKKKLGLA